MIEMLFKNKKKNDKLYLAQIVEPLIFFKSLLSFIRLESLLPLVLAWLFLDLALFNGTRKLHE